MAFQIFKPVLRRKLGQARKGQTNQFRLYHSNLPLLLDEVVPKMTLEAKLERTYRNLHSSLYRCIFREQFKTFEELQILGQREEVRREKEKTYRPPPPPKSALFPHFAYKIKKRTKAAVINTTDMEIEHNVAAVKEVPKDFPISKWQKRNGTAHGDIAPVAKPVQQNSKGTDSKKGSARARQSAPADNSSIDHQRPRRSTTSADKCWVCKKEGHWARGCKERQGILCYRCGHPGFIVATCPNCSNSAKETESGNNKVNHRRIVVNLLR